MLYLQFPSSTTNQAMWERELNVFKNRGRLLSYSFYKSYRNLTAISVAINLDNGASQRQTRFNFLQFPSSILFLFLCSLSLSSQGMKNFAAFINLFVIKNSLKNSTPWCGDDAGKGKFVESDFNWFASGALFIALFFSMPELFIQTATNGKRWFNWRLWCFQGNAGRQHNLSFHLSSSNNCIREVSYRDLLFLNCHRHSRITLMSLG